MLRYIVIILLIILVSLYTWFTINTFNINNYIGDEVWYPTSALNILKYIFHVSVPMSIDYPSNAGIQTYINPEHPPLAKYIMALSILFLGYNPIAWRVPSWILGSLTLVMAFLFGLKFFKDPKVRYISGLLCAFIVALDPNFWVMHGIAMLDGYAGFFSLLSLYLLLSERKTIASIALSLAFLVKESLYMLIFPYLYYLGEIERRLRFRVIYGILIPLAIYLLLSIPIIIYFGGFMNWLQNSILHSLNWAITSGHISPGATSQISEPWDWFFNINPFYLGYNFYATTNPLVLLSWIFLTPFSFILKDPKLITTSTYALSIWLGFVLVYFLGNNTLFSFYVSDFSTVADVYVVVSAIALSERLPKLIKRTR
ncbi:MAG: glycosyltransferase family 39 protein [Sulfolobaceae archaeon]